MLATSASSERYFSQGALNLTKLRNRMTKETFNKIMCLRSWGVVKNDIEREDKKKDKVVDIKEIEEALFTL
jgi:hypothetical protein